ncbi:MAG: hydrolase [Culturomica sp.]|jgi:nicotinamidase-related amidase|nr:hydrolase [Culturomica sp.]
MSSYPTIRDPKNDHLLTPENSALVIIDYQPVQVNSINSMPRAELIENIVTVAKVAVGYKLPIILSTVNKKNGDTIKVLRDVLGNIPSYERTAINSWEDKEFVEAVKKTGRKKLIMTALWTEVCLSLPTLDALHEGYEVYPVVDAVGGTSEIAHKVALKRMAQAGARLTTVAQFVCELQRDWNRAKTVPVMVDALVSVGAFLKSE